jgi:5-methylcytosine-specific restriction endonuclease McrA
MPMRPTRPCAQPGCPELVRGKGRYCAKHARKIERTRKKESEKNRPTAAQRGYGTEWRKIRDEFLSHHPVCERCGAEATQVHHRLDRRLGGGDDWDNLEALCKSCHSRVTWSRIEMPPMHRTFAKSTIPVVVIAGPPGSGKTTYVREHAHWGDLIVDVDALYHALSGLPWYEKPNILLPFVMEARDAVLQRLARKSDARRAWVITGEANYDRLQGLKKSLGAEAVVVMTTSSNDCMRNIYQDERRAKSAPLWEDLVRKWWDTWQSTRPAERS